MSLIVSRISFTAVELHFASSSLVTSKVSFCSRERVRRAPPKSAVLAHRRSVYAPRCAPGGRGEGGGEGGRRGRNAFSWNGLDHLKSSLLKLVNGLVHGMWNGSVNDLFTDPL